MCLCAGVWLSQSYTAGGADVVSHDPPRVAAINGDNFNFDMLGLCQGSKARQVEEVTYLIGVT